MQGEPATHQNSGKTPTATSPIEHSLNDAEVLANYAVRNNISGVQEAISGVAKARELCSAGNLKGDEQRAFYANYSTLASAVAPVTVASLKDSLDEYGVEVKDWFGFGRIHRLSRAGIVARQKRAFATVALFLLIFFQSYWLIGNSLILAFQKPTTEEIDTIVRQRLLSFQDQATAQNTDKNKITSTAANPEESDKARVEQKVAQEIARVQVARAQLRRREIGEMLAGWAGFLHFPVRLDPAQEPESEVDRIITISGRILDVLQQYVLPLLYGLLGAMAYVLRTISQQARDRVYRVENETGYDLRIWLGILGGLAIGWFFKPNSEGVASISPLALAFVAGYSVELLFTAMDRIVSAFSAPEKKGETAQPAVRKAQAETGGAK